MPSEIRHIIFRPGEIIQAIKEYYRRRGQALPRGTVLSCNPECYAATEAVRLRLVIAPDIIDRPASLKPIQPAEQVVLVETPDLAAALILYCRDRGIPLPYKATKSLQVIDERLCLVARFA
jgi:hypothetical protein